MRGTRIRAMHSAVAAMVNGNGATPDTENYGREWHHVNHGKTT